MKSKPLYITGLYGGQRVLKNHPRIEACGAVDELNSSLGIVRATGVPVDIDAQITRIQRELFSVGAELAAPDPDEFSLRVIQAGHIEALESAIDRFEAELPPLPWFVLPAGTPAAAHLHFARAVCRRAERSVVTLAHHETTEVASELVVYLHRVSDLLFVLSRLLNHRAGVSDEPWHRP